MSLKTWWQTKNRKAKTITTLAVLIILNTGLCFLIPSAEDWSVEKFHLNETNPYLSGGLMGLQAILDLVLLLVLFCVGIFWRSDKNSGNR